MGPRQCAIGRLHLDGPRPIAENGSRECGTNDADTSGSGSTAADGATPAARRSDRAAIGVTRHRAPVSVVLLAGLLGLSPAAVPADAAATTATSVAAMPTPAPRGWQWPLRPRPLLVRPFDAPEQRWSAGHRGVDLAGAPGAPVHSPAAGTVVFVGVVVDRPVLTIAHADGLRTSVEPVTAAVERGDRVAAGQVVGHLIAGPSHCSPATCLHWGVRLGEDYVDPLSLILDRRPSVLLPLSPGRGR
ncbi:hypothetical protein GCM10011512_27130 [Tersicoccus solisilvae]|uniref:M23ase beta-sheet core domain-containing protein n=2 Tax=Tersicoccus solisilvae TaxID=1882339 RepID=A0ABQ1PKV9_9MICC|nr:hypothetical protein GCM10011512_27130 [Tersicoccus solisilvae]